MSQRAIPPKGMLLSCTGKIANKRVKKWCTDDVQVLLKLNDCGVAGEHSAQGSERSKHQHAQACLSFCEAWEDAKQLTSGQPQLLRECAVENLFSGLLEPQFHRSCDNHPCQDCKRQH